MNAAPSVPALTRLFPPVSPDSRGFLAADDAEPDLIELYAYPDDVLSGFLRANFVSTLDGAVTGPDHRSGSINNSADLRVFRVLRSLADVIVVGASTAAKEEYRDVVIRPQLLAARLARGQRPTPRLAILTGSGHLPASLVPSSGSFETVPDDERPLVIMPKSAPGFEKVLRLVGAANVVELDSGAGAPSLTDVPRLLAARGLPRILCEGGPRVLADLLEAGAVDELCLTWATSLIAGDAGRIAHGSWVDSQCELKHLLHCEEALIGRWAVARA